MVSASIDPSTEYHQSLSPLSAEGTAQVSEFRVRKRLYSLKSIHPADVDQWIQKGWEIKKQGKRKTQIKKPKSHNELLEDRAWCLLYNMGYRSLSGKIFTIEFRRDDGSIGSKQIDTFACDDETAFVIECKSKEDRGRRSLQKDIQETISLQNYIRKSIYQLYKNKSKPKIIWAYFTYNIIWSEQDVLRASDGRVNIITENELQYFEAFIKHMGPAGKYQVLGEFLKNEKIAGLENVRLPAIRGKIGGETFYSFVATPRRLLKIAFINHQALNHPDERPAYQRMISSSRIKEIQKYITNGGYFPNNILVNFTKKPKFDLISNKINTDENVQFGWITLPSTFRSVWIIDGQHRLYGYSRLYGEYPDQSLFILGFDRMSTHKEANLFVTINHKQKSVPKSLLISLLADLKLGDDDPKTALSALASFVVRAINTDRTSALSRRFAIHGLPPEPQQNLTISEAVNGLNRSELLGRIVKKNLVPGPLSSRTDIETVERAKKVINSYFERLRRCNPARWEAGRAAYISVNPGIRAQLMLIAEIVRYLQHKKDVDFHALNEDQFADYIIDIADPVFRFIETATDEEIREKFSRKFGEGGVKEYLYYLFSIIHDKNKDFGPEEFIGWIKKKDSDKIEEANKFIMQISEMMSDFVIKTLKDAHGTQRLPSGDPAFWEFGIENKGVKANAYKKQQDDNRERRKPKEAYLDIVDFIDIAKQKNNWEYFKGVFNLPMQGEKGKTYYLDWIDKFNEVRKIAAHKNILRTYTDEDLDFLDWLRANLYPKLVSELRAHG